jgi:hypothetical protein
MGVGGGTVEHAVGHACEARPADLDGRYASASGAVPEDLLGRTTEDACVHWRSGLVHGAAPPGGPEVRPRLGWALAARPGSGRLLPIYLGTCHEASRMLAIMPPLWHN